MVQHLVSRVLLRRWSKHAGKGPISGLDLRSLQQRTDRVEKFGGIKDADLDGPDDIEKIWANEVEKRLPHAFKLLDAGKLLNDPASIEVVKNTIVLHWARGFAVTALLASFIPEKVDEVTASLLKNYSYTQAMNSLKKPDFISVNKNRTLRDQVFTAFLNKLRSERFLDQQFLDLYRKGQKLIEPYKLEIWHSEGEHQFLIGDAPVVTYNKEEDKVGALQGVAWNDADAMFMPFGPHHVIALAQKADFKIASPRIVEQLNVYQVRAALREVFFHPDSKLGETISQALRSNPNI